ncbi:hypothetical protein FHH43_13705 [Clostridium perfringens]|nr:hypothetical protein [Clostridium perfringens]
MKTKDFKETIIKVFGKEKYDKLMEESRKKSEKELIIRKKENREELIEMFGEKEGAELYKRIYEDKIKSKLQKQEEELKQIEKENTIDVVIDGEVRTFSMPSKRPPKLKQIVTLNIDNVEFDRKPTGKEIGAIQNRLNNNISKLDIEEFAKAVALEGRTFKAAAIEGKTNDEWVGQDIFAIDIDNKPGKNEKVYPYLSMEDAYKRCEKYNVMPIFIYPTFSSTSKLNKYRLVFRVPTTVKDLRLRRLIMLSLMEIFPERDKSCIDAARIFFGGCQELYKFDSKATINPVDLNLSVIQYLKDTKGSNYSSAIKNFCIKTGLNTVNSLPDINLKNKEFKSTSKVLLYSYKEWGTSLKTVVINFNIDESKVAKLSNITDNKNIKTKFKVNNSKVEGETTKKNFKFNQLEDNCQLWHELVYEERALHHQEIFSIACTMWRVEGAEKRIVEAIENNSDYGCKKENKINTIRSCRRYKYSPRKCIDFCPHYNTCEKRGLMINAVDNKRGNIRKLNVEEERITIGAAEVKLKEYMKEALESKENEIVIIKAPTGIGKTTTIGNLRTLLDNTCIAYPSHKLGKDIQKRLQLDALYCKDLELSNKSVLNNFRILQSIGDYKGANAYLDEYVKVCCSLGTEVHEKDIKNIREYRKINKEINKTDKTILCTHTKALLLENNNINRYIFDEDVFYNSCFKAIDFDFKEVNNAIVEAERKGLSNLVASLKHISKLADDARITPERVIFNDITCINKNEIKKLYTCNHNNFNPNIKINIKELLTCKYLKSNDRGEVLGGYIQNLPNKKCIILSATANEEIYKAAFPNRKVIVKHIGLVEEVGKTVLHYKAFSRSSLTNDFERHLNMIKEEATEVKNIITFAIKENEFKKEGFNPIAHFGNCTGLDAYKGQDLIVIGTPHVDSRVYVLMAKLLKKDIVIESIEFNYSNVVRNGFEFSINTFNEGCGEDTELLREIQAYFLESELVQAVGRARTLRTNATVHLFSNYPLRGCELYSA